jgi:hypothetical protein
MNQNEEELLLHAVLSARNLLAQADAALNAAKHKKSEAESYLEQCEKKLISYYDGTGLKKSEIGEWTITLGQSQSVDVTDIDCVLLLPLHTKITKEVNKSLIKAEGLPASNWLSYKTKTTLTIKHKG